MTFLDIALQAARRGWAVFPCVPRDKQPLTARGFKDASAEESLIRRWWSEAPSANVAIAAGDSGITVLDVDLGLTDLASFNAWREAVGLPLTFAVHTGRRGDFGTQLYFAGTMNGCDFELNGCKGQVKSLGGYVMAAGSIHPSGETYEVIADVPLAPLPEAVRGLRKPAAVASGNAKVSRTRWTLPVHESEDRTGFLMEQLGRLRNIGCGFDALFAHAAELNDDPEIIADALDSERFRATVENASKYEVTAPDPVVTIGGKKAAETEEPSEPKDWRTHYHTREETVNAPKPEFLIDGFLQRQAIVGLAGFVGQKKSLVAQNVSYSLCSGEPLFGQFAVTRKPSRVLYLCPEMALIGFANRITRIGLLPFVGDTFFYATMSLADGVISLPEITKEEAEGAVIILDTAIRFVEGDENSSQHMKEMAVQAFQLIRNGAEAVIVLAHSNKTMAKSSELTLDNAMRGSSELTAFLSSCWAVRTQDPDNPYESATLLKQVKPRDFEAAPFEVVTSRETCRMSFVEGSTGAKVVVQSTGKPDRDGQQDGADALIRANMDISVIKLEALLNAHGIKRGTTWIHKRRVQLKVKDA